jgi:fatty acid desaturase
MTSFSLLCGVSTALLFFISWIVARAFVHHLIISFVILSDHVGLYPGGSILSFARNHSVHGILRLLIHPHNNGYHLTHHLLPGIPFYGLAKAHKVILQWPPYAQAEHCQSYFFGNRSAIRSWCRESIDITDADRNIDLSSPNQIPL